MKPSNTPEFKEWLLGVLRDDTTKNLCVTFTKKDGTNREMYCTLSENLIPSEKAPKGSGKTSSVADEAVKVFDVKLNEWRSFRWDSIVNVAFEI